MSRARNALARNSLRCGIVVVCCGLGLWAWAETPTEETPEFNAEQVTFYEQEVLPILKANCYKCHGPGEKIRGGLRLTHRNYVLDGGDLGPVVDLKDASKSLLLKAIGYQDDLKMPPSSPLPAEQVAVLKKWVEQGLPFSKETLRGEAVKHEEAPKADGDYWAYKAVQRPELPSVKHADWVRSPIDAFILQRLEQEGLTPAPAASRGTMIRRAYYDLTGLPPTPEEVQSFVNDPDPAAYPKLIDRLLASPHYGEKWGRHWLDVVHYAETNGYERDGIKPHAWRFRDYVIDSFNQDKPFDQFIREQLAGDELPGENPASIVATGYYRLGVWDDEPADPLLARYDELDDIVATTSQVFLGMTMNCCRCHDHKIDPLPQTDYYKFVAFFQDVPHFSDNRDVVSRNNLTDITPPDRRRQYEAELKKREARMGELRQAMTKLEEIGIKKMPAEDQRASEGLDRQLVIDRKLKMFLEESEFAEYEKLKREHDQLNSAPKPARDLALSVNNCQVPAPVTHVLLRGNPHVPGDRVEPGYPEVLTSDLPAIPEPQPGAKTAGRRLVLANWIASPGNPLTGRVFVNRLWQYHFGKGIVGTPNDFGLYGDDPTHPELMDWLAAEFTDGGWTLKRMHRLLMLSSTYQMSSAANAEALQKDPANALYWRFPMRRLTAEELRDSFLAVSGQLNLKAGGPSIYPPIPREVLQGQSNPGSGWHTSNPEDSARRSVYVHVKRSLLLPILATHDAADTDTSCPVRYNTIVPTQSLGMLNSEFSHQQADAFAQRLERDAGGDVAAQVRRALWLIAGREPRAAEVEQDLALIQQFREDGKQEPHAALKLYCLLLLNTNEFVYLD